jgi:hypothetical protein
MPLITLGGLPLLVGGDSLTTDPDCCCYYYPPPPACPPCCIRINWGTFDDSGDLVGTEVVGETEISIKITVPSKFQRIVCDGESITVAFGVTPPGDEPTGGFAFYGAAWGHVSESPEATKVFDRGLIDWVEITDQEFSATLAFSKCWLDSPLFLAYLTIGLDDPEWSLEIEMERCPDSPRCCDGPDCEPCCYLVLPAVDAPVYYQGKVWQVSESASGYRLLASIDTTGPAGLYCPGEGLDVEIEIIPPRWDPAKEYSVSVTFDNPWTLTDNSPAVNPADGSTDPNTPPDDGGSVNFGTKSETEYSVSLAADCADIYCEAYVLGEVSIVVEVDEATTLGATFGFESCEEDNSGCCCPPHCVCDCYWPLSKDFCETAEEDPQFGELYEVGGPTQLTELLIEITADSDVFCGGTTDTAEIRKHGTGLSKHFGICQLVDGVLCPRDNGLMVDVEDTSQTCAPSNPPHGRARVTLGTSDCDPNLQISLDFVMPDGPFSAAVLDAILTDCNEITGSGTMTVGGVVFTWTITGTITGGRPCPCEVT